MNEWNALLKCVNDELETLYGRHDGSLEPGADPLEVLIETVLSQNTTASNMRRAFTAMRSTFPTWDAVLRAPADHLEEVLRPAGLARTRSRHIQEILRTLHHRQGGFHLDFVYQLSDQEAEAALTRLPGVGPKTARCVLLFAFRRDVFPVDTHILRILTRLAILSPGTSAEAAHRRIPPHIPSGSHLSLHLNLVRHGRDVCHARRPACQGCSLGSVCAYGLGRSVFDS